MYLPTVLENDHQVWRLFLLILVALLSGARNQKNISMSKLVYNRMKTLFPDQTNALAPAAVLLANVYASAGELDKASDIRMELYKSGAKKKVGLSMTVVNGRVYVCLCSLSSMPIEWNHFVWFCLAISGTRPIASSILRDLWWTRANLQRTDRKWSSIRLQLDHSTIEWRWDRGISSLWTQRKTGDRLEFCCKSHHNTNSSHQKPSCVWRLP